MLNELETAAMVNQRISCNTRFLMISLRESSVNHHQFAIGLDGIFTLRGMNGNVAVDDVAIVASNAKSIENTVAHFFVVAQLEIGSFFLFERFFVAQEIALEGSHLRLVE